MKCYGSLNVFPPTYQEPATGNRTWKTEEAALVDVNTQQKACLFPERKKSWPIWGFQLEYIGSQTNSSIQ